MKSRRTKERTLEGKIYAKSLDDVSRNIVERWEATFRVPTLSVSFRTPAMPFRPSLLPAPPISQDNGT